MEASVRKKGTGFLWNFDNSYARLPGIFHRVVNISTPILPKMVIFNHALAKELTMEISGMEEDMLAKLCSGKKLQGGALPIAQAYAGHQFGHFTLLGDGRAALIGEHLTKKGVRFDILIKGSGKTHFSRRGDGKASLLPMLREYIMSESMRALGIPTTRSLAVILTGETVYREDIQPGAILTRVAKSHIRAGTFEFAAYAAHQEQNLEILNTLANYTINRHFPELLNDKDKYLMFFHKVAEKQISLVSQWQSIGFIHGVMNTDNMAISGETIDYGPCAFMDNYHPNTVFSSIDSNGRYAYGNQPHIALWNLARFAETLLPLFSKDESEAISIAQDAMRQASLQMNRQNLHAMLAKLGIAEPDNNDQEMLQTLLALMEKYPADFTNTFSRLTETLFAQTPTILDNEQGAMEFHSYRKFDYRQGQENETYAGRDYPGTESLFSSQEFSAWQEQWEKRLSGQKISIKQSIQIMSRVNPSVIPRNHLVEESLSAAKDNVDLLPMQNFLQAMAHPYQKMKGHSQYYRPAPKGSVPYKTFCGT